MPDIKSSTPHEEAPQPPLAALPEELNPALTLKGAGGLPGVNRLGPWFRDTGTFLQEVGNEFNKISWPSRNQIAVETVVVILVCAFLTGLVMGYDWIFSYVANRVFYHQ